MAEFIQKQDTLNEGREKLNAAITDAEKAKVDAGKAVDTSGRADVKATQALAQSQNTQTQLDTIIIESGTSDAEVLQARVDENGDNHSNLKSRIDDGFSNISTHLVETTNQTNKRLFYNSITGHKTKKAKLVLSDDDLRPQVWTKLKPVIEQEKVPISCAVITNRVGNTDLSLTLDQMKELERIGFNFVSHTQTHPHLADLQSEEEIERELKISHNWLRDNGFTTYNTAIIYPFGSQDKRVRDIARKYYKCGVVAGTEKLNQPPLDTYRIDRVYYNLEDGTQQIQHCKDMIDEAVANGNLLIIGMHCFYQGFSPEGLIEVIQYAKSREIDIISLEDALVEYGNIIDVETDLGYVRMGANGAGNFKDYIITTSVRDNVDINTPISAYPNGKTVSNFYVGHPNVGGFPGAAGILETLKISDQYNYQEFSVYRSNDVYRRHWDGVLGEWSKFRKVANVNFDDEVIATHNKDWVGSLRCLRSQSDVVNLRGILTAGNIGTKSDILTIPRGFYHNGFTVIDAFNHTQTKKVEFYITNAGQIRLLDNTTLSIGDSIRFNALFRI